MILYRPVGLQELALIYDSGMMAFPAHLPQQPIFYPVLQLEYARQIAANWNIKSGQLAGYVTEFRVEDQYINKFEIHTVGAAQVSQHQEFWIPAEDVEEFNKHILGHIKVVEAHFGNGFQGFVPEKFALQGKNAIEQFTLLTNSYLYKRMDFYLEIKRNHKAVFLNYPFWQIYEFKNPGLKEKVIKAIKEAWFTSFPKIPLANPAQEDAMPITKSESPLQHLVRSVHEDIMHVEQTDSDESGNPVLEDTPLEEQGNSSSLINPDHEEPAPIEETNAPAYAQQLVKPVEEQTTRPEKTESHFMQGVKLGLNEKYREAIDELFKAIKEDPNHVVAQTSLGVAFHRSGEDDRALACFETALRIDPIYAEAHYFRADILYGRGNVREAIAGYTIAVGLNPNLIEAHQKPSPQDRLTAYTSAPAEIYRIAKPAHRILDLNNLLESNPSQADLLKERAADYYRLRNYTQAIADYTSFLASQPDDGAALYARGVAYQQLGQTEHASEDFQRAIAINPQLSNVYIDRGVTLGNLGNYRQSILSLTEGIRLAPKNPNSYFNRGVMYFQAGDLENAIADFSMVIQLSSKDEEAYYWRGIANEATGRQQEAIADYRQFLAISQNSQARQEIEQKLNQRKESQQNAVTSRSVAAAESQIINQVPTEGSDHDLDIYRLISSLGERTLHSTWYGSGVHCSGEKAEALYALTDQNQPIQGRDLLDIASGIHRTIQGDFQAFDPDAASPWLFLRAWDGNGFYIETNDPKIKQHLKAHFPTMEEVEGAIPPYESLFIAI